MSSLLLRSVFFPLLVLFFERYLKNISTRGILIDGRGLCTDGLPLSTQLHYDSTS